MLSVKQQLYNHAIELGFLDLKAARAEPLEIEFSNYKNWLDKGYHADLLWMERNPDKRRDITRILPGGKSVIVTAHSYFTGHEYPEDGALKKRGGGKISRYAWGDDYHEVVLEKLKLIEKKINELKPDSQSKCYVDTGPVLEKQWAVKAGIGWQGKNGMLIKPKYGSYFFIGIILTTAELEPDKPIRDHCGKCTKCLDVCPTKAIIQPKVVDSNKCLSYWTIESKADNLPDEIADNLNGWAFGCDICQEVCPWNRFASLTDDESFLPRHGRSFLLKNEIEYMDTDDFRERFRKSPVKRAKLSGMKKNFTGK